MAQNPGQPGSPRQAVLIMRLIGGSMAAGVTLFAFVGWYMHLEQGPVADVDASLFFNGFLALFLISALGAMFVWRSRVAPILERPEAETEWRPRAASIQTGLIITWAILEGAALFGEVVYFLTGHTLAGILGVALIWGGIGLTWPKESWL